MMDAGTSYAAFKIGGDCSKPSYMGEWKAGAWKTVDGNLVKGEDDGAKITIVFTIQPKLGNYNVCFMFLNTFAKPLTGELPEVTVDDELITFDGTSQKSEGAPIEGAPVSKWISHEAGLDFSFRVKTDIQDGKLFRGINFIILATEDGQEIPLYDSTDPIVEVPLPVDRVFTMKAAQYPANQKIYIAIFVDCIT